MPAPKKSSKTSETKGSATKSAGGKQSKQSAASAAAPATPMIDASGAAESAARMVKARLSSATANADHSAAPQSDAFKQLKESIGKPGVASVAGFLNSTAPAKKNNIGSPFGGPNKQVGRNQTFGADVNRSGVPRRTGG